MSETYSPTTPPTSRLSHLPALAWGAMTVLALSYVYVFGFNLPYADEWEFVPALVGPETPASWLWQQHNEHRLPLSRAIYLALFRLTNDFRAGMYVQIIVLAGLSLWLMRLAATLRGRIEWTDVFFPVSLLHLGHWENFLMGYQICFVFFCALTMVLGVVALRTRRETAFRSGMAGGGLLLAIALTGGFGLAMIPAVVPWLVYLATVVWRSSRSRAIVLLGLAALSVVYLAVYFAGYHRPEHHPEPSTNPIAIGEVAAEVLAMGFGYGLSDVWWAVAAGELVAGALTLALLARQGLDLSPRPANIGVAAVLAGIFGLALAIGAGRGAMGTTMGLAARYSLLVWPVLGLMYLVWVKAGRRWLPVLWCMTAAIAFVPNTVTGMFNGEILYQHEAKVEADARAGLSATQIVERQFPDSLNSGQMDRAVLYIPLLRAAKIGAFGANQR